MKLIRKKKVRDELFQDPRKDILEIRALIGAKVKEAIQARSKSSVSETKIKANNFIKWLSEIDADLGRIESRF